MNGHDRRCFTEFAPVVLNAWRLLPALVGAVETAEPFFCDNQRRSRISGFKRKQAATCRNLQGMRCLVKMEFGNTATGSGWCWILLALIAWLVASEGRERERVLAGISGLYGR